MNFLFFLPIHRYLGGFKGGRGVHCCTCKVREVSGHGNCKAGAQNCGKRWWFYCNCVPIIRSVAQIRFREGGENIQTVRLYGCWGDQPSQASQVPSHGPCQEPLCDCCDGHPGHRRTGDKKTRKLPQAPSNALVAVRILVLRHYLAVLVQGPTFPL